MGKYKLLAIHYYKNVKSLFVHYANEHVPGSWGVHASVSDGNFFISFSS
jgi:hypothetical protein